MKLLAIDHMLPGATPELIRQHLLAEARHVWELHSAGIVREVYSRADRPGTVLMLEAHDEEDARRVLESFPLARAGLVAFDIVPLAAFRSLELLFEGEDRSLPT